MKPHPDPLRKRGSSRIAMFYFCFLLIIIQTKIKMENPFQIILDKLDTIENLIKELSNNAEPGSSQIMDLKKTSSYLGLSASRIYNRTSKREIPHFKQGKKLYFKKSELDEWLTTNKITSKDEIEKLAATYIATHKRKW